MRGIAPNNRNTVDYLGKRLEEAGDSDSAVLCYMCAGNIDKTVTAWARQASALPKYVEL